MPDSYILITDRNGNEIKIDALEFTRGVDVVKSVRTLENAALPTYIAYVSSATAASKNHISLFNGLLSGLKLRIREIYVVPLLSATITGTATTFTVQRITTTGTGTAVVIRKLNTADNSLPAQITSSHTFTVQPTITANTEMASISVNAEETVTHTKFPLFEADNGVSTIVLNEGEGIVISQSALAGAGTYGFYIYFTTD